jgi:hypothetical protein
MTIKQAARSIYSDATGANGDLSQNEVVARASDPLASYVHEMLRGYDVHHADAEMKRVIGLLVAWAMLEQHNHTENMNSESFIASLEKQAGF